MTHGRDVPPVDRAHPLVQRDNILPRNEKKSKGENYEQDKKKKRMRNQGNSLVRAWAALLIRTEGGRMLSWEIKMLMSEIDKRRKPLFLSSRFLSADPDLLSLLRISEHQSPFVKGLLWR